MKYDIEVDGVSLKRDVYYQQFSESGDKPDITYSVEIYGNCIEEDDDPIEISKRLKLVAKRLEKIANFLGKKK